MKSFAKIMGGVIAASCAGAACYMMLNKKTRKKAYELGETMVKETKNMMK